MRLVEKKIVRKLVQTALELGYFVCVHDGEEYAKHDPRHLNGIMAECAATDQTTLFIYEHAADCRRAGTSVGHVFLVHGNDCEVISDYSDNDVINGLVKPANAVADSLEAEGN